MPRTIQPDPKDFTTVLTSLLNGASTQFGGTISVTRHDDEIRILIASDATGTQPGLRRNYKITVS